MNLCYSDSGLFGVYAIAQPQDVSAVSTPDNIYVPRKKLQTMIHIFSIFFSLFVESFLYSICINDSVNYVHAQWEEE